uniref:Leucine-rich repeat-containing N-terminal plant-type domain-containing protein n=1 Tax=Oryza brachyantha TaxID=4533 RepID=J3LPW4_ORYBR
MTSAIVSPSSSSVHPRAPWSTIPSLQVSALLTLGLRGDARDMPGISCSKTQPSRVTALDLESSGLNGQLPPCVANLTSLTRIHLPNNQLGGQIPPEIGQLTMLSYLNLSSNKFSGMILENLSSPNLRTVPASDIPPSLMLRPEIPHANF